MAERRYVKCVKCGSEIDKKYDLGWVKNESSGRYTCASCSRSQTNGSQTCYTKYKHSSRNTPSAKTYKVTGAITKIAGIVILVLSLLLLLVIPPVGIFFAILGILFFLWGKAISKKAKGNKQVPKCAATEE